MSDLATNDPIVECPKCQMRMTERQEREVVACLVEGCPLEHADSAGTTYTNASEQDQEKMGGIVIQRIGFAVKKRPDTAESPNDADGSLT